MFNCLDLPVNLNKRSGIMVRFSRVLFLLITGLMVLVSCKKEAGEGGNASIYGTLIVHNYNGTFTQLHGIYPGADEDVYIIYDGDKGYSDRTRTNYNGVYEFRYLRPGKYTVYAYSKDSTLTLPSGVYAVLREVTIQGNRDEVKVDDMIVFK